MSFLDPKPISATAIAAQVANPASVIGSQLSATILNLIPPTSFDGGNASSTFSGTFNFDGGSAS